ncbi:MAG: thiamine diphosphokinase [Candidatus Limnocylindria bacterium]
MRAVVVAAGDLAPADVEHLSGADLVVAADGGASSLDRLDRRPALVVGDFDSIDEAVARRLGASGTRLRSVPPDKDETDMELAVDAAVEAGADRIVLLGGLGGLRIDHAVANLLLLGDTALAGRTVEIAHGLTRVRAVRGGDSAVLEAGVGDIVSLLPIDGDADGVVTEGLRYPLHGERLRFGRARGVSNEVVARPASVALASGALLVFEIRTSPREARDEAADDA